MCAGPRGCLPNGCAGLCGPGRICQYEYTPPLSQTSGYPFSTGPSGPCGWNGGYTCVDVTAAHCFSNPGCQSACAPGSSCEPITAANSSALGGVCAGSGAQTFYYGNDNTFHAQPAIGWACLPCAPGDPSCGMSANASSCFTTDSCACPPSTICMSVGSNPPCNSSSPGGATCVPYSASAACYNSTAFPGTFGYCDGRCVGPGAVCVSASMADCVTLTGPYAASAAYAASSSYVSFYKCIPGW